MFRRSAVQIAIALLPLFVMATEGLALEVSLKTPVCSFSIDHTGEVRCTAGVEFALALPGGFAISIGQEFPLTEEYSYLVFRNRRRGRDDVFKIPQSGRVEILANQRTVNEPGKPIITLSPDPKRKNCFIIELGIPSKTESISAYILLIRQNCTDWTWASSART